MSYNFLGILNWSIIHSEDWTFDCTFIISSSHMSLVKITVNLLEIFGYITSFTFQEGLIGNQAQFLSNSLNLNHRLVKS